MAHYFTLEVFVHALDLADPAFTEATFGYPSGSAFPRVPYAVAFQFLDYPLLLVYAKEPLLQTAAHIGQEAYPNDYLTFDSGKSCILQADPDELQFLVEQTPLYISLFHVKSLPKPTLLAAGHTPLLISPPPDALPQAWGAAGAGTPAEAPPALTGAAIRQVGLFSPQGGEVGTTYVSCRLTHFGSRVPPLSTLSLAPHQPLQRDGAAPHEQQSLPPSRQQHHVLSHVTIPTELHEGAGHSAMSVFPHGDEAMMAAQHQHLSQRLQRTAAAAAGLLLPPAQPPSLYYANDPLLAQQPQPFVQRALEQQQLHQQRLALRRHAWAEQQQQQQPVHLHPQGSPRSAQVLHGLEELERQQRQQEEEEEEADDASAGGASAWEAADRRHAAGKPSTSTRSSSKVGPKPGQTLFEVLFNPRDVYAAQAAKAQAVSHTRQPYQRVLAASSKGGGAKHRPATTPSPMQQQTRRRPVVTPSRNAVGRAPAAAAGIATAAARAGAVSPSRAASRSPARDAAPPTPRRPAPPQQLQLSSRERSPPRARRMLPVAHRSRSASPPAKATGKRQQAADGGAASPGRARTSSPTRALRSAKGITSQVPAAAGQGQRVTSEDQSQQQGAGVPAEHAAAAASAAAAGGGGGPGGPVFHMTSVMMWEVMSLVAMRSVMSQAISAMGGQMSTMASQVAAQHAVAAAQVQAQAQAAAVAAMQQQPMMMMQPGVMMQNMPPGMPIIMPNGVAMTPPGFGSPIAANMGQYPYGPYMPASPTPHYQQQQQQQWQQPQQHPAAAAPGSSAQVMHQQFPSDQQQQLAAAGSVQPPVQARDRQATAAAAAAPAPTGSAAGRASSKGKSSRSSRAKSQPSDSLDSIMRDFPSTTSSGGGPDQPHAQSFLVRPKSPLPPVRTAGGSRAGSARGKAAAPAPPPARSREASTVASEVSYSDDFSSAGGRSRVVPSDRPSGSGGVEDEAGVSATTPRSAGGGWIKQDKPPASARTDSYSTAYEEDFDDHQPSSELSRIRTTSAGRAASTVSGRPVGSAGREASTIEDEYGLEEFEVDEDETPKLQAERTRSKVAFSQPSFFGGSTGTGGRRVTQSTLSDIISEDSSSVMGELPTLQGGMVTLTHAVPVDPAETVDDMDDLLRSSDLRASGISGVSSKPPLPPTGSRRTTTTSSARAPPAAVRAPSHVSTASGLTGLSDVLSRSDIGDDDDDDGGGGGDRRHGRGRSAAVAKPAAAATKSSNKDSGSRKASSTNRAPSPLFSEDSNWDDDKDDSSDGRRSKDKKSKAGAAQPSAKAPAAAKPAPKPAAKAPLPAKPASESSSPLFSSMSSSASSAAAGGSRKLANSASIRSVRRQSADMPTAQQRTLNNVRSQMSTISFSAEDLDAEDSEDYELDFDDVGADDDEIAVGLSQVSVTSGSLAAKRQADRYGKATGAAAKPAAAAAAATTRRPAAAAGSGRRDDEDTQKLMEMIDGLSSSDDGDDDDDDEEGGGYGAGGRTSGYGGGGGGYARVPSGSSYRGGGGGYGGYY